MASHQSHACSVWGCAWQGMGPCLIHAFPLRDQATTGAAPSLLPAGAIDAKELHVGLLLVYDKLNKLGNSCSSSLCVLSV